MDGGSAMPAEQNGMRSALAEEADEKHPGEQGHD
jgi:hypothetical protein